MRELNLIHMIRIYGCVLKRNSKIIFDHPYAHISTGFALTLYVIELAANFKVRVCDDFTRFCVMLIAMLNNHFLVRVRSMENFIDNRDDQLRHFFKHRPKYVVKNSIVVTHIVFLSNMYYSKFFFK